MAHLSINGFMAGATFCGQSRSQVLDRGEDFFHPNVQLLETRSYRKKICSECLAVWDNPERPTNPMPGQPLHRAASGNY
ncbi:hypothetical protein Q1Z72_00860 [Pseudomonas qingdaonensis]|uniref:hypothetical protein n=1 Tax=Pseudomonas qingdaonensis TaxID=2056231 RepID=UPI00265FB5D1|nr:hypothetical protein [Pseudomonas qingdaonensis]WKL67259.1 hypothetical protein Q1Z72_00860 [Pseudomonas qingdaonensis]